MTQETFVSEYKTAMSHSDFVKEILDIVFDVQNKGIATVFFDLSGHVQLLNVRIYFPVWVENEPPSYNDNIYLDIADRERLDIFKFHLKHYIKSIS